MLDMVLYLRPLLGVLRNFKNTYKHQQVAASRYRFNDCINLSSKTLNFVDVP